MQCHGSSRWSTRTGRSSRSGFQYGYDKQHHRLFEKRLHRANKGDVYAYDSIYRVQDNKQNVDLTSVNAGQEIKPETFSSSDRLMYWCDGVGNRTQVVCTVANASTTTAYTLGGGNNYSSGKATLSLEVPDDPSLLGQNRSVRGRARISSQFGSSHRRSLRRRVYWQGARTQANQEIR